MATCAPRERLVMLPEFIGDAIDLGGVRLRLRLMEPLDRAYVATRWVTSFERPRDATREDVRDMQGRLVDALLDSRKSRTIIVCSEDVPTTIHAWACAYLDQGVLHYAFVDPKLRGHKLARAAITAALDGYPDSIETTHPWPLVETTRFHWHWYRASALLAMGASGT